MSYLFYVNEKQNAILRPDTIKLCPELGVLSEKETLVIILTYDYYSPYNQFPEEDRRRKALAHVFNGTEPNDFWNKPKIMVAIECYRSLQYNMRFELKQTYLSNIQEKSLLISQTKDADEVSKLANTIYKLRKFVYELDKEIVGDIRQEGIIVGNSKLSFLEQLQENRNTYNALFKK